MAAQISKHVSTTEPIWHGQTTRLDLIKGLNFYNTLMTYADSKQYAAEFFKNRGDVELAKDILSLNDGYIKNRGFVLRMITRGMKEDVVNMKEIEQFFHSAIHQQKVEELAKKQEVKATKPAVIAKTISINNSMIIFDELIDATIKSGKAVAVSSITGSKKDLEEVRINIERSLDELKNYTEYFRPDTIKPLKDFYQAALKHIINISAAVEKTKTRISTPKKVNPVKMTAKVKYMKEFQDLKLKSIPVSMVVGAKKAYVYDTESRKIYVFVTNSSKGFMFSGTTLKNFDPEKSVMKIIRKPEEFWKNHPVTLSALNKSFNGINSKELIAKTGRMNDKMIILKVSE